LSTAAFALLPALVMGVISSVLDGCSHRKCRWTTTVDGEPTYEREAPSINGLGRAHMIIFALDGTGSDEELTSCVKDGKSMSELARTHCGVTSIIEQYERFCTPSHLEHACGQVSSKMRNDDYLVFYFSGNCSELTSGYNDEDEQAFGDGEIPMAISLYGEEGKLVQYSCCRFAELVASSVNPKARVLLLFDCHQNAPVVDLTNGIWDDIEAVTLSGAEDKEESEGGLFTKSMLLALQLLQKQGDVHYSAGAVFNEILKEGKRVYGRDHHLALEHSVAVSPSGMAWPLLPTTKYDPNAKPRPKTISHESSGRSSNRMSNRGSDKDPLRPMPRR